MQGKQTCQQELFSTIDLESSYQFLQNDWSADLPTLQSLFASDSRKI